MKRKRPFWVWVICIVTVFGLVMSAWGFYLIETEALETTEVGSQYLSELGLFDYLLTLVGSGLGAAAAITLFMLKKTAVNLFLVGLIFSVLSTAYAAIFTPWLAAIDMAGAIGIVAGFGLSVIIYLYARSLRTRGILT